MGLINRIRGFLHSVIDDGESSDVTRMAVRQQQVSTYATKVSKHAIEANGRLRDAARAAKSTAAFSDFERAVKHRD